MKKIICFLITFFLIIIIYNHFSIKKINYVSIGDNSIFYFNEYLKNNNKLGEFNNIFYNKKIKGLKEDIKINRTIRIDNNDYFIKKVLRESDILVISVGMDELSLYYNKDDININYQYFNKMYNEIDDLLKEIKKYAQEKIIFLGYYNPTNYYDSKTDEFFFYLNNKLNELMSDDVIYIDLYELIKGNQYKDSNSYYLNKYGYQKVASIIEFYLD